MPFKSKAQEGYLWANNPKVAKEFASKTPKNAKLPEYTKSKRDPKGTKIGYTK